MSSRSGPSAVAPPYTPIVEATPTRGTRQSQAACSTLSRLPIAFLAPGDGLVRAGRPRHGAREVNDAGDLVTGADVQQRGQVGDVGPLGEYPPAGLAGQVVRQHRLPALDQHARLAQVEQRPRGVRPDEPQPAGHQDHLAPQFTSTLMTLPTVAHR